MPRFWSAVDVTGLATGAVAPRRVPCCVCETAAPGSARQAASMTTNGGRRMRALSTGAWAGRPYRVQRGSSEVGCTSDEQQATVRAGRATERRFVWNAVAWRDGREDLATHDYAQRPD